MIVLWSALSNTTVTFLAIPSQKKKRNSFIKADTVKALNYLALRNTFYDSKKTIKNLVDELSSSVVYAHYCGEGMSKTPEYINVEKSVKQKNLSVLISMLQSISCEEQAFGTDGIRLLEKTGYKFPKKLKVIANYIAQRNSDLTVCRGCLVGIIAKANN